MKYMTPWQTAPRRPPTPIYLDPQWFAAFLADRGTRKPSAHTIKAYRQDFDAIAALIAGGQSGDTLRMSGGRHHDGNHARGVRAVCEKP
jgi:hypothetical protein